MHEFKRFSEHYAVLAMILAVGLMAFVFFRSNPNLQQIALWTTVGGYLLWGVGHHLVRKDLNFQIVLEYFLVALIGGIIIQVTLLQR